MTKKQFLADLQKTQEQVIELMEKTTGQSDSALWHLERKKRITASNFEKVWHLRKSDRIKIFQILSRFSSLATNYEIEHKPIELEAFSKSIGKHLFLVVFTLIATKII